ncbi:peptidase M50 [Shimia thalassica]|uniref:peptidase M50 n=1 Tax=Shimia thalassica TaxID=1715693 RepID=UPI002736BCA0|nr:peptidase M50 [Shimia thalassica]MDP2494105.1 peptidase M50 [Shimia thalassica]
MATLASNPFSSVWPRVALLKPALRPHAELYRQFFRGGLWYIVEDRASGRFFRFSPEAYSIIGLMDGHRTLAEIYRICETKLGESLPSQDEIVQLLSQLYLAGVLTSDAVPDLEEIGERSQSTARRKLMQSFKNPLGIRIPLFPIDGFVSTLMPLVRPLFTWVGFFAWLCLVVAGVVSAGIHWQEVTTDVTDRVLSAQGLALLLIAYPLVKTLHELGHGFAVKHWGGTVREVGIMLLVFVPVPYVDASAATGFPSKRQRIVVSAAGVMVELALAAIAMLAYPEMQPGPLRALAFNVMLIGGVSTLLFNGNPLLRFDGYYVFSDLIEIPNLGQRSKTYLSYLVKRYLFGLPHVSSPVSAPGEKKWLAGYAIAAFLYRIVVMIGISLLVAGKFFFIGIGLAIWAVFMLIGMPIVKSLKYLLGASELENRRGRALIASAFLAALIIGPIVAFPVPDATLAQGVVWVPGETRVVAQTDGWLREMGTEARDIPNSGAQLGQLENPIIDAREAMVQAQLDESGIRLASSAAGRPVQIEIEEARMNLSRGELDRISQRRDGLVVRAPQAGRFEPLIEGDLQGRFVRKGALLGYVLRSDTLLIRTVVPQTQIDLVNARTSSISVRLSSSLDRVSEGHIVAQTPSATYQLPSAALGTVGGGPILSDPGYDGTRALESVFVVDIAVDRAEPVQFYNERVHVRFDHGTASLATQGWRIVRQVFLDRFGF